MNAWDPRCEPFSCVTIMDVGACEGFVHCAVGVNVVPFEIDGTRADIRSGSGDLDELGRFRSLLCYETFENFQIGDVHVNCCGVWLELFVEILAKSVCDVCMDRLITR